MGFASMEGNEIFPAEDFFTERKAALSADHLRKILLDAIGLMREELAFTGYS